MKEDWERDDVCAEYARVFHPHGDRWRQALVNPLVLALARSLSAASSTEDEIENVLKVPKTLDAVLKCMGDQRALMLREPPDKKIPLVDWQKQCISEWHSTAEERLNGVGVLDLGCGEGYLGRWLGERGVIYAGIDASGGLIQIANRRLAKTSAAQFKEKVRYCELDITAAAMTERLAELSAFLPKTQLVTAVVVLDHLADPSNLCNRLYAYCSSGKIKAKLLIVTLNTHYFLPGIEAVEAIRSYDRFSSGIVRDAIIASTGATVKVCFRHSWQWEFMFRTACFSVDWHLPLFFDESTFPEHPSAAEIRDVNPFDAWLLSPEVPGHTLSEEEKKKCSTLPKCILTPAREALLAKSKGLQKVEYAAGQRILTEGDIGRFAYIVLAGEAALCDSANQIRQVFRPGDLFGELELPDGNTIVDDNERHRFFMSSRYPFSCYALNDGCGVIRIPHEHIDGTLKREAGNGQLAIGGSFYYHLRNNLRNYYWSLYRSRPKVTFRKTGDSLVKSTLFKITKKDSEHNRYSAERFSVLAQILLSIATQEAGHNRGTTGESIFVAFDLIAEAGGFESELTYISNALQVLSSLNIVDAISMRSATTEQLDDVRAWWNSLQLSVASGLLSDHLDAALPAVKAVFAGASLGLDGEISRGDEEDGTVSPVKATVAGAKELLKELRKALPRDVPDKDEWIRSRVVGIVGHLSFLHFNFVKARYPSFITIKDLPALRRLAMCSLDVETWQILHGRAAIFPKRNSLAQRDWPAYRLWEERASGSFKPRLARQLLCFSAFVDACLASSANKVEMSAITLNAAKKFQLSHHIDVVAAKLD